MEVGTNRKTEELVIKLTEQETEKLNNNNWIYNHDEDVLILKDEDGQYIVYKDISTKSPYYWRLILNHRSEELA